jgi:hypothetical protein
LKLFQKIKTPKSQCPSFASFATAAAPTLLLVTGILASGHQSQPESKTSVVGSCSQQEGTSKHLRPHGQVSHRSSIGASPTNQREIKLPKPIGITNTGTEFYYHIYNTILAITASHIATYMQTAGKPRI